MCQKTYLMGTVWRDPKTLLWSLRKHPENAPETGHPNKSLFAPGTHRGDCCLRVLDPGNGTTVIYRYKCKHMPTICMQSYANICKHMQTYANICTYMQIYVRCPNFNFLELFGRFEFRILNSLKNYLGGSNFELRIRARFICRLCGFRINF